MRRDAAWTVVAVAAITLVVLAILVWLVGWPAPDDEGTRRMATDNFDSDQHALLTGMVFGMLMKHFAVEPVIDDDGDYTAEIVLDLDDSTFGPALSRATIRVQAP